MPEGPEIRREADAIAKAVAGKPLVELELGLPALRSFHDELFESHVTAVDTHGKAMLTRFACGLTLYSHNQLYGRWYVRKRGQGPRTNRSLRVGLHTSDWSALLYSATDVRVLTDDELAVHPFLRRLGPDVLEPGLDWRAIAARLRSPAFSGRALGGLYLDQGFIAGIGNYLRSEILHYAGLHPGYRPADLAVREVNELARQLTRRGGRRLVIQVARRHDPAFITQLQRIGLNLNQLVKRAHILGGVSPRVNLLCEQIEGLVQDATAERLDA